MTDDTYDSRLYLAWVGEDFISLPNIEERIGYFIFRGGRIVMTWNAWWSRYVFWQAPELIVKVKKAMFVWLRWFAGAPPHNRGRHWDRKRR